MSCPGTTLGSGLGLIEEAVVISVTPLSAVCSVAAEAMLVVGEQGQGQGLSAPSPLAASQQVN